MPRPATCSPQHSWPRASTPHLEARPLRPSSGGKACCCAGACWRPLPPPCCALPCTCVPQAAGPPSASPSAALVLCTQSGVLGGVCSTTYTRASAGCCCSCCSGLSPALCEGPGSGGPSAASPWPPERLARGACGLICIGALEGSSAVGCTHCSKHSRQVRLALLQTLPAYSRQALLCGAPGGHYGIMQAPARCNSWACTGKLSVLNALRWPFRICWLRHVAGRSRHGHPEPTVAGVHLSGDLL